MTIGWHSYRFAKLTAVLAMVPVVVISALIGSSVAHAANTSHSSGVSIHRYAEFDQRSLFPDNKTISAARTRGATSLQLNVYGNRYILQLEDHSSLLGSARLDLRDINVQRGSITGIAGSWIRLTRVGLALHGLLWDGSELYAIEPTAEVSAAIDSSRAAPTGDTVIFKLSDTTIELPGSYCAAASHDHARRTGLAAYQVLAAELPQPVNDDQDAIPTLRLEMEVLADAALRAEYDSDDSAIAALVVRLNNIDGIYSSQLGLAIEASDIRLIDSTNANLSTSSDPNTLLNSLAQLRGTTLGMSSYAATHLFTGRDLDGDILGIAYVDNLCEASHAASLSEVRGRGAWLDTLVAAHELGHQLGAVHDGAEACSSTPDGEYLMSSYINGSDELSSCSRERMLVTTRSAACLVPINLPVETGPTGTDAGHASSTTPAQSGGGGGVFTLSWLLLLSALYSWRTQLTRHDISA